MKFSHIIFDADRTLFDFDRSERDAFRDTALAFGIRCTDALYEQYQKVNDAFWKLHEEGKIEKDILRVKRFETLFAGASVEAEPAAFNAAYTRCLSEKSYLFDGALDLCASLSGSYPLLLATNGTACVQEKRFALSPIRKFFKRIYISEQVGYTKPDPRFFAHIIQKEGIAEPRGVLMVGDSLRADIVGAKGAGFQTCWYNPPGLEDLSGVRPDYTIRSFEDLKAILK